MGLLIASSVVALFSFHEVFKIWTTLKESRKRCTELEALLGVPLDEDDLIAGEQYVRVDMPDVVFVRRIRHSAMTERVRAIRACNLAAEDALPPNTVFSVIQDPDGQRRIFVETLVQLERATVKAN